jgi:hypothetical protein
MEQNKILFPYNFTDMDDKALKFIVETYGHKENVLITLFHAYAPVPEIISNKNSIMDKISGNLHYLRQKVVEQESKIIEVRQNLLNEGFLERQIDYLYQPKKKDIANGIIMLARDNHYNTIILNRTGNVMGFFKTSVFNKIITTLKNVNVTIVT